MKILFTKSKTLSLLTMICMLWACNKSELVTPPTAQSTSTDEMKADEIITAALSPGIYKITRFTDEGDNETSEFRGYTFNFQADGDLVAKTNENDRVRGTWHLNMSKTRMATSIPIIDKALGIRQHPDGRNAFALL